MAIVVNGSRFVTLADEFFVNGAKVYEAYANGVKVYPEGDMPPSLEYWVEGSSFAHFQCKRNRETWIMPDWWPAEGDENYTYRYESNLPVYTFTHTDSRYGYVENVAVVSLYDTNMHRPVRANGESVVVRTSCNGTFKRAPYGDYIEGMWGAAPSAEWWEFTRSDGMLEEVYDHIDFSRQSTSSSEVNKGTWKPGIQLIDFTNLGNVEIDGKEYIPIVLGQFNSRASADNSFENGRSLPGRDWGDQGGNFRGLGSTFTGEEEVYNNRDEDSEIIRCRFASASAMSSSSNYGSLQEWAFDWLEKINAL